METCYKMMPGPLARALPMEGRRFEIEPEITACIMQAGYKIIEVPIGYTPRKAKKLSPEPSLYGGKFKRSSRLKSVAPTTGAPSAQNSSPCPNWPSPSKKKQCNNLTHRKNSAPNN